MLGGSLSKSIRTIAIVQARMGSSRLPGKMMMDLCDQPLLYWVLSRVKRTKLANSVLLAISDSEKDNPLAELAQQLNVPVFRGSETDVLGRFVAAAHMARADRVVRVCGDNPLIAPEEIDRLINFFEKTSEGGYPMFCVRTADHPGCLKNGSMVLIQISSVRDINNTRLKFVYHFFKGDDDIDLGAV